MTAHDQKPASEGARTVEDIVQETAEVVNHLTRLLNEARVRGIEMVFSVNREEGRPFKPTLKVIRVVL